MLFLQGMKGNNFETDCMPKSDIWPKRKCQRKKELFETLLQVFAEVSYAFASTSNPLSSLAVPVIFLEQFCKISQELVVKLRKQLLDSANFVTEIKLTWKDEMYRTLCKVG